MHQLIRSTTDGGSDRQRSLDQCWDGLQSAQLDINWHSICYPEDHAAIVTSLLDRSRDCGFELVSLVGGQQKVLRYPAP
jgi:hypothetical protein